MTAKLVDSVSPDLNLGHSQILSMPSVLVLASKVVSRIEVNLMTLPLFC